MVAAWNECQRWPLIMSIAERKPRKYDKQEFYVPGTYAQGLAPLWAYLRA